MGDQITKMLSIQGFEGFITEVQTIQGGDRENTKV